MLIVRNKVTDATNLMEAYVQKTKAYFPMQLKVFIKKYNGGETPNTTFRSGMVKTDVRALYGFGNVPYNYENTNWIEKQGKRYWPVGTDSFGNEFLIEMEEPGRIYFLDHERENDLIQIANSLVDFFSKCSSSEISENAKRTPEEREQILIKNGKAANISEGLRKMWRDEYNKYSKMVQEEVEI